jgi:hypothetical protein
MKGAWFDGLARLGTTADHAARGATANDSRIDFMITGGLDEAMSFQE